MADRDEPASMVLAMSQPPPEKTDEGDQGAPRDDDDQVASVHPAGARALRDVFLRYGEPM
jgi:hypothetical protein